MSKYVGAVVVEETPLNSGTDVVSEILKQLKGYASILDVLDTRVGDTIYIFFEAESVDNLANSVYNATVRKYVDSNEFKNENLQIILFNTVENTYFTVYQADEFIDSDAKMVNCRTFNIEGVLKLKQYAIDNRFNTDIKDDDDYLTLLAVMTSLKTGKFTPQQTYLICSAILGLLEQ